MRPNWFVGLPVAAGTWLARLGVPPPGVRRFHDDDLHLTVAFLGPVGATAAARAFAEAQMLPLARSRATLGAVVPMGSPARFSALSARLDAGEAPIAAAIAAVRDAACDAAGAARDPRAVLPHLTIARVSRRAAHAERRAAIHWAEALDLRDVTVVVDRVALYTWARDRTQRLFEVVDELVLGA